MHYLDLLKQNWAILATILGVWAMIATGLNRVPALTPDKNTPKWKLALHTFLIDWPAMLPKVNFKGIFGLPFNVPFLSVSTVDLAASKTLLLIGFVGLSSAFMIAGCAPGTDGLRQACANADMTITSAYQVATSWYRADQEQIRASIPKDPAGAKAKYENHRATMDKVLSVLDDGVSTKLAICNLPDAIDAGVKGDIPALLASLLRVANDVRNATVLIAGVK